MRHDVFGKLNEPLCFAPSVATDECFFRSRSRAGCPPRSLLPETPDACGTFFGAECDSLFASDDLVDGDLPEIVQRITHNDFRCFQRPPFVLPGYDRGMDRKPITFREGLPWIIPLALIGAGAGVAVGAWAGWIGDLLLLPATAGVGGAFGGLVGLKIADVRRRARP